MSQLAKAIALASKVFESKTDKGGKPYILHCLRVMNSVDQTDEELMQVAVMHDVVEDSDITIYDLAAMGFSERVTIAVKTLTHDKNIPYDDYIKAIALNKDARVVKLADLTDNSSIVRLKGIGKRDFDRMEKYHKSFLYLNRI